MPILNRRESHRADLGSDVEESDDDDDGSLVKVVPKKNVAPGCNQVYDKCNYCTFCSKQIRSKISRHLLTHKEQKEVNEIILLPKRCQERMSRLQRLANEGNFKHNAQTFASGSGQVVVEEGAQLRRLIL